MWLLHMQDISCIVLVLSPTWPNVLCQLAVTAGGWDPSCRPLVCVKCTASLMEPRVFIVVAFSICLWFQEYDIYSHRLNYYTLYDIHIFYLLLCAQTLHIVLKFMPGPGTRLSVVTDNPNPLHYCRIALLTVPRQYVYVIYLCTASLDVFVILSSVAASVSLHIVNFSTGYTPCLLVRAGRATNASACAFSSRTTF